MSTIMDFVEAPAVDDLLESLTIEVEASTEVEPVVRVVCLLKSIHPLRRFLCCLPPICKYAMLMAKLS